MPKAPKIPPWQDTRDPARAKAIIDSLLGGATLREAAGHAGIHKSTLCRWIGEDAEFREQVNEARTMADDPVEWALYDNAVCGDTTAEIFWLKNRRPARWRDKQTIEHEHGGPPLELTIKVIKGDSPDG